MNRRLKILPLEERIVLDAAATATVATTATASTAAAAATAASATGGDAAAAAVAPMQTASTNIIYVDQNATGANLDGSTWNKAFSNLQDALNKAAQTTGSDQIWIAQGTYTPTQIYAPDGVTGGARGLTNSNLVTFDLPTDVSLYGGFKAGMTDLSQRNPTLYTTTLSGDIMGNDVTNSADPNYAASKADNAWHVVTAANDVAQTGVKATLDGLSIVNGYANGPTGTFLTPIVANNYDSGAGLYANFDSTLALNNVTFKNNYASGDGGGLFTNNSDVTINKSTFLNNSAGVRGGALEVFNTFETTAHTTTIDRSQFQGNTSGVFGGAIVGEGTYAKDNSALVINNSHFSQNTALEGGAVVIDSLNTYINGSKFVDNLAIVNAGAVATTNVVSTLVSGDTDYTTYINNSSFTNNVAVGDITTHAMMNNIFNIPGFLEINFARGGGAVVNYMYGNLDVYNSDFTNNKALSGDGGAILNGGSYALRNGEILAAGVKTNIALSTFTNNRTLDGNGAAIASESLVGYLPAGSAHSNDINILGSKFTNNDSNHNGGSIYLSDANANILLNKFQASNDAVQGDQVYASDSVVNHIQSSHTHAAKIGLTTLNVFQLLNDGDLYLS